jgi:hypothetical protein
MGAEGRLAELLKVEPYGDGSGWDWNKLRKLQPTK